MSSLNSGLLAAIIFPAIMFSGLISLKSKSGNG